MLSASIRRDQYRFLQLFQNKASISFWAQSACSVWPARFFRRDKGPVRFFKLWPAPASIHFFKVLFQRIQISNWESAGHQTVLGHRKLFMLVQKALPGLSGLQWHIFPGFSGNCERGLLSLSSLNSRFRFIGHPGVAGL